MDGRMLSWPMILGIAAAILTIALSPVLAQGPNQAPKGPWMDKSLSPDQRAICSSGR